MTDHEMSEPKPMYVYMESGTSVKDLPVQLVCAECGVYEREYRTIGDYPDGEYCVYSVCRHCGGRDFKPRRRGDVLVQPDSPS